MDKSPFLWTLGYHVIMRLLQHQTRDFYYIPISCGIIYLLCLYRDDYLFRDIKSVWIKRHHNLSRNGHGLQIFLTQQKFNKWVRDLCNVRMTVSRRYLRRKRRNPSLERMVSGKRLGFIPGIRRIRALRRVAREEHRGKQEADLLEDHTGSTSSTSTAFTALDCPPHTKKRIILRAVHRWDRQLIRRRRYPPAFICGRQAILDAWRFNPSPHSCGSLHSTTSFYNSRKICEDFVLTLLRRWKTQLMCECFVWTRDLKWKACYTVVRSVWACGIRKGSDK